MSEKSAFINYRGDTSTLVRGYSGGYRMYSDYIKDRDMKILQEGKGSAESILKLANLYKCSNDVLEVSEVEGDIGSIINTAMDEVIFVYNATDEDIVIKSSNPFINEDVIKSKGAYLYN